MQFDKPEWPTPVPGKHYMREIGMIVNRKIENVKDSPGDDVFCQARRAFHLSCARPGVRLGTAADAKPTYLRCAFRRLFSDGAALHRFELGWSVPPSRIANFDRPILEIATDLLASPVAIGAKAQAKPIGSAAPGLSRLLQKSSQGTLAVGPNSRRVEPRRPLLLIAAQEIAAPALCDLKEVLFANPSLLMPQVYTGSVVAGGESWRLVVLRGGNRENVRAMRLAFLRLHAEVEAIRAISSAVVSGALLYDPVGPSGVRLSSFFESSGEMLFQKKFFGLATSPIFNSLIDSEALAGALQLSSTQLASQRATQQVKQAIKINRRIQMNSIRINQGPNSSITGSPILQGSTGNTVIVQAGAPDLNALLEKLQATAKEAIAELPPEKQATAADHLDRVLGESRREKPDRKFWELSKDGLLEATKTVAKMTPALLTTAGLIAKFLFP